METGLRQVHFSRRTEWGRDASRMAEAVAWARARGAALLDLTSSNPTACGLELASLFASADAAQLTRALAYEPDPLGMRSARELVCEYYAGHGAHCTPEQVLLTASTSEAYSHLFRLLCEVGDEVLVAQPSYPLFEYLADLADVRLRNYPLFWDHGWWIDFAELERAIGERTRAVVVVHPNNPTGHATSTAERDELRRLCERHGLALIVDEVFLDYPLTPGARLTSFAAERSPALTIVLSGLSKVAALPGMKLGWMAVLGPKAERAEALARLEIIADTFLSIGTPAQLGMARWMAGAPAVQQRILERVRGNLAVLREAGIDMLPVEAGWSGILRLTQTFAAEDAASALLQHGVVVHPGSFYGIPGKGRAVVSLLTPVERMRAAALRMLALG